MFALTAASMNRIHDCTCLPSSSIHASVKYHYRQPNLGDGKDESRTWGADRIERSLAAGQRRGSTSAFRGALCALVANRTGPKTLLLRPNWTVSDCQSPGSIPVSATMSS
jgi:hypothetical protein